MQFDYRFIEVRNPIISQNNVVYAGTAIPDTPSPVPEPSSLVLLGSGLGAIVARKLRRRSQRLHAPSCQILSDESRDSLLLLQDWKEHLKKLELVETHGPSDNPLFVVGFRVD